MKNCHSWYWWYHSFLLFMPMLSVYKQLSDFHRQHLGVLKPDATSWWWIWMRNSKNTLTSSACPGLSCFLKLIMAIIYKYFIQYELKVAKLLLRSHLSFSFTFQTWKLCIWFILFPHYTFRLYFLWHSKMKYSHKSKRKTISFTLSRRLTIYQFLENLAYLLFVCNKLEESMACVYTMDQELVVWQWSVCTLSLRPRCAAGTLLSSSPDNEKVVIAGKTTRTW